ncbi:histidinol-phosphate transaminase [Actinomycetospora termitidis]|uniref:Aromatic amino acid aminotransferase n=1 Tax=Actinomycetospora termitidis TaxID=3053470 RepID=A0ABT7M4D8_9PSEU|nr:histidinol-phosphate transaminase [Actinomycetospora sp. Odt1-22]MDL5154622.1 histidinol-phosphate transaminase [Actinomycetospora sp. Odt1-22]
MTPLRPDLSSLPAYVAGRTVPGAVKLASNEVALPPHPHVREAVGEAVAAGNRYPDITVTALSEKLAGHLGVPRERITVGCGSVALCGQLISAVCSPGDEVVFPWRSFEAYPIVSVIGHATPVPVPNTAGHEHDLEAMLAAITDRTRIVFVCNPNNPTGTAIRRRELTDFLARVPEHVLVVLDEAYREFVADPEVPDGLTMLDAHPHVAVLRTFSKAHRLAGLRVGYAVAAPDLAAALRSVAIPFSVSSPAQAAALAALDVLDELEADARTAASEAQRMAATLREMGYEVPETQANFCWLPLGDRTQEFAEHALDHKVVVRAFHPDGVRISAGVADENDLLIEAARSFS